MGNSNDVINNLKASFSMHEKIFQAVDSDESDP